MIDARIATAFEAAHGFPLEPHLVVLAPMGSHSHGTYPPPTEPSAIDDVDLMGFVVPALPYHLGLERWEHWVFRHEELDVVLYSLGKAGSEFLRTGTLQVFRADAEDLKAIKRGEWTLERVKEEAERLFEDLEQARSTSPLAAEPDRATADALLIELHRSVLGIG